MRLTLVGLVGLDVLDLLLGLLVLLLLLLLDISTASELRSLTVCCAILLVGGHIAMEVIQRL
jgi:hypothetical protein